MRVDEILLRQTAILHSDFIESLPVRYLDSTPK